MKTKFVLIALLAMTSTAQAEKSNDDPRQLVKLPEMMQVHMLGNMRDHLVTFGEMSQLIAEKKWDDASEVIEQRIGMSSLGTHQAEHMAKFMPPLMRKTGTQMHHAASRLARTIQTEEVDDIFKGVAEVMDRCAACHAQFRIK